MSRKPWFAWCNIPQKLLLLCSLFASMWCIQVHATTADISSVPLGTRSATNVAPNLMFILDDSGSMASDFMPDNANDNICKTCPGGACTLTGGACEAGTPPFFSSQFNTIYYNPNVVYKPGVDYTNVSLANQTPAAARNDPYSTSNTSTSNLVTGYTDIFWCTVNGPSPSQLADSTVCRRNGINTANPFAYTLTSGLPDATFRNRVVVGSLNPHYYLVTPREYCTDETLITCTLSTTPTAIGPTPYNIPAPMRWCRTTAAATSATAVSGGAPRDCQALIDGTYRFPRHGNYTRTDVLPATTTYPRATTRTDCAGAVGPTGCSYGEELQNFANWYSYYRTRILMMKTVPGRVFASIGNDPNAGDLRVGFVTINASSSARYLKIADFKNNTHRQNWFTKLYSITPGSSTPLREALSRVGRHFAGVTSGLNSFMPDDPMIASCQRNYALLTTDGYWNGNAGQNLGYTGTGSTTGSIGNQDNIPSATPPTYVDRGTTGTLDGVGSVTVTSTPVTTLQQAICVGNGNATFSGPTTTPCGCSGGNKRVMQRTRVVTTVITATDGVTNSTVPTTVDSYQPAPGPTGTCTLPAIISTTTPITDTEQVICTGTANATFSANGTATTNTPCGCAAGLKRVMQRTISRVNTTITNDGVVTSNSTTTGTTAFAPSPGPEGTCTVPLIVTTVTPVSDKEHVKCVGTSTATFSDGSSTPCGCAAGQAAIKQRIKDRTLTVITTDGVVTSSSSANSNTFSNFIGCTNQLVSTAVTPNARVEEQVFTVPLSGVNPPSTFAAVNGVAAGANAAGTCAANQEGIIRRTTTWNSTVVSTDGVAGATTISSTAYAFSTPQCRNRTTTTTTPVTETAQNVDATSPTNFVAALNGFTPAQFTYSSCTGGRTARFQRVYSYTKTDTQVGAGAPTTTFTTPAAATYNTLNGCGFGTPSATATVVNNGAPTVTSSATTLVAAGTTNSTGSTAVTNTGTNLAVTLAPNPQTTTGTATATNNSGTTLVTTLTPNPLNGVNGVATPVSNGGTTVVIALSPNPSAGTTGTVTTTSTAGGTADTLADVAMYYYKTDLRTTGPFAKDNVPVSGKYIAPHQHMVTFTMGLGLDGLMTYRDDYETATAGDFFKIKTGATNCIWTTGTCNWSVPVGDSPTAIDDLWHAAVNGRGKYFSAKVPATAENGIKETLAAVNIATGSAAAAATSTPNLTTTNNSLYRSTYRTVKWDGEVVALAIDPATAVVNLTPVWSAATQLNSKGGATSDSRTIYTFDGSTASKLKSFTAATLTPSELANFQNKCIPANWSQCAYLAGDATRLAAANNAANLVDYLRGQRGNELSTDTSTGYFRAREFLLGDTVSAKPAFMGAPDLQYGDAGYSTFKTTAANVARQKTLFVGANDGMMHALNADTGAELWAYIPKMLIPNLYRLANDSYGSNHNYFVDGSPTVTDVFIGGAWKTVLVGGLNLGGRGYYALDVTDPTSPKALWEICSNAALCAITDNDMGLSFSQPIVGKRPSDGKWVALVASGYNNIAPGTGGGYLYMLDLATGAVLEKVATAISGTNVGNSTTPSGFAKISGFVDNFVVDSTIKLVYGGDLLGNMWRVDLATSPPVVQRIAELKDGGGKPQSVTTRPEITKFDAGFNAVYIGTGRFLGASDTQDPATLSPPEPFAYQQTIYAFKDTNTNLGSGSLRSGGANLVRQSLTVIDAATRSITNNVVNWNTNNGWYVDLNPVCVATGCSPSGESPGERINIDMQLVRGTLVVVSNEPNADTCTAGGESFLYQFNYSSGSYVPGTPGGVVGNKIGNTLAVGIVIVQPTTGQLTGIITTADGNLPEQSIKNTTGGSSPRRAAWRELLDTRSNAIDAP